jgi:hypothetical protein
MLGIALDTRAKSGLSQSYIRHPLDTRAAQKRREQSSTSRRWVRSTSGRAAAAIALIISGPDCSTQTLLGGRHQCSTRTGREGICRK